MPKVYRVRNGVRKEISSNSNKSDIMEMLPSWKGCSRNLSSTDTYRFECADCSVTFTLSEGAENGGHSNSTHTGSRPLGQLLTHLEGVPYTIVNGALELTYEAADTAGEVTLNVHWTLPHPPYSVSQDITIYAYVPDLLNMTGNSSLITWNNINSHPGDGYYMTELAGEALLDALSTYKWHAENVLSIPPGSIVIPNSEGASLKYGGLFDIFKNYTHTHCTHRLGDDVDIGMALFNSSSYKADLLNTLDAALVAFDYSYPKASESPDASPAEQAVTGYHWHAHFE
ncbi:hypothetical protein [Bdellovibrio bacteriovorus]|nr:hypothetical protein [Bdellovibrio bacteriovorus]